MKYLVGIDNGGTVVKVGVFDENGVQIIVESTPLEVITTKPGYTERDMEELWETNATTVKNAILKSKILPKDIVGVSFSGHGKGLYMIGYDGKPSYNGILSTDSRAWKEVEEWYEKGVNKKIYEKTFQEILAVQPVSLLAWFKSNKPEILKNTKYIFSVKDYIRYKITGNVNSEYTDSSGSNLINFNTKNFDVELLKDFGIEECFEKFPPLKNSFDICGTVTKETSEKTLLPEGIPVAAGMFDVNACGIASGLYKKKHLCMIAGTWSINEYISNQPVTDGSIALNSFFCIPNYYLIEESSPTSAGNMEWFITNLMKYEKEDYQKNGKSIYSLTNEMVESILPENNDIIFLPFLNGTNEDALAKGTFVGLTAFHEKKHMLRAVYEGIVFSHLTHVKKLLKNRELPKSIRLSGGASNSDVWVQIFADALQIPIDIVEEKELGAHGAAMAAGIASGVYKDYEEAITRTVTITKTVQPRIKYKELYEKKYATYRAVIDDLKDVWKHFKV